MFHPGDTLNQGAYRIERELGAGGFGVVYLAEEVRLRRQVAIKTLLPDLVAREPGLAEAFYAEARLTAGLAHPHILPILFVGEEARGGERCPYIVMEYIEGGDLEAVLTQGRGDLPQRLRWMRQIADGLAYAHAQGVIHRDLKPRNVFLTRTNTAKIGDFGLAKVMGAETQTFLKGLGTAAYIAPEQVQGRPADARADLYALGVMYYQILTGHLPYDAPGVSDVVAKIMAICYQHVNAPVPSARAQNPDISPALDALIQRLMAKTPDARPASAAEVIPLLEACLLPAGPPVGATQTARPGSLGGVAPVPAVDSARDHGSISPEATPTPVQMPLAATQAVVAPPPRRLRWPWLAIPAAVLILGAGGLFLWPKKGGDLPAAPAPATEVASQEAARRQAEAERQKLQAEVDAARKQVEELRLAKLREEEQRQAGEERKKLQAEADAARKQAEAARLQAEDAQKRLRGEEAARKQVEEATRQKAAEGARHAEIESIRRQADEERKKLQAEADAARKQAEAARLQAEEAQRRLQAEENTRKQADAARKAAEAARQADAERMRREEEARVAQPQEQRRQEEARRGSSPRETERPSSKPPDVAAANASLDRPAYTVGQRWIRNDGEYTLSRIDKNLYVFAAPGEREIRLTRNLGWASIKSGAYETAFDPPIEVSWPLRVGSWGELQMSWQVPLDATTIHAVCTWAVEAYEDIRQRGGKIKAVRMVFEWEERSRGGSGGRSGVGYFSGKKRWTLWYAPHIAQYVRGQFSDAGPLNFDIEAPEMKETPVSVQAPSISPPKPSTR